MEALEQQLTQFIENHPYLFLAILIWSLVWKGIALWKSSRLSHKKWFAVILVVNTLGILEIIYIYFVARKYQVVSNETK